MASSCAVKLESDPLKVEGEVHHIVEISATQLAEFYKSYCEGKDLETEADVDKCVTDSLVLFWKAIEQASN